MTASPSDPSQAPGPRPDGQPTVLGALTPMLRRWKLVAGLTVGAGFVAAFIAIAIPRSYAATTTFVSAAWGRSTLPIDLATLATQFGFNIGPPNTAVSSDFFVEILRSRELLGATLESAFDDPEHPHSQRALIDILDVRGKTPGQRTDRGIRLLEARTSERVDRRTDIVSLRVEGRPPALIAAVANRMVQLLNQFNLERLQLQSRERRRFTETRRDEAERELSDAEARHVRFVAANPRYRASPVRALEENRLARQVELRQEVFQTLTREYEQARLAEVRDTPVLTIIDAAVPPERPSFPPRTLIVLLSMLAGGLTALALIYAGEYGRAAERGHGSEYREFADAWHRAMAELRKVVRIGSSR